MKVIAILALVLISVSSVELYEEMSLSFSPQRSILTLLSQVEAQMKSGGPLETVLKLLDNFRTTVTEEQVAHDNLHEKQKKECDSEFEFRRKEVSDAEAASRAAQETLDGCQSQRVRAKADLEITKNQLGETRQTLVVVVEQRKKQAYDYETQTTATQMIIKMLEESLVILEEIWQGQKSFVDLTKHSYALLRTATKARKVAYLQPLMAAFAQLSIQSSNTDVLIDETVLNRVKTILKDLRDKFQEFFNAIVEEEDKSKALFEEDKARLETIISNLETNLNGLQIEIADLDKCVVTQTGIVSTAVAKQERNQKLLDDATNLCNSTEQEYVQSTKSRKQELKLLSAIKERVEYRFSQLSEGARSRGDQDQFSYENQSAYEKKSFK